MESAVRGRSYQLISRTAFEQDRHHQRKNKCQDYSIYVQTIFKLSNPEKQARKVPWCVGHGTVVRIALPDTSSELQDPFEFVNLGKADVLKATPQSPEECEQLGGRWEVLGFSGPGCNLPSSDGGKVCSAHGDCESLCLADDSVMKDSPDGGKVPDHFRIDQINAQGEALEGVCSMWKSDFGCHAVIEKGKIVVICID